jgi:hypothetical protein
MKSGSGVSGSSLRGAFFEFMDSDSFRQHPLQVRATFHQVAIWLPPQLASIPITAINASFAKMLRDKAARERGWKFGNHALLLVQSIVNAEVDAGTLSKNRVRQVPKLLPPRQQPTNHRRRIEPIRRRLANISDHDEAEKSDEREF